MAGKEKPLKKYSVRIRFEHLNPALQGVIGEKVRLRDLLPDKKEFFRVFRGMSPEAAATLFDLIKSGDWDKLTETPDRMHIRNSRAYRAFFEWAGLALSLASVYEIASGVKPGKVRTPVKLLTAGIFATGIGRLGLAKWIQLKHRQLVKEMKQLGILQPKFEGNYPRDWINPTIVAKTHPSFFVNWRGDLIFPKMTRTEYARYQFQKSFAGKIGLNAWRWRAYLEPPEAPKPVIAWAKEKARQWAAAMRPKPAFEISTVRLKRSMLPKRTKPIRRI